MSQYKLCHSAPQLRGQHVHKLLNVDVVFVHLESQIDTTQAGEREREGGGGGGGGGVREKSIRYMLP